jgi:hypothetical protein
MNDDIRNQFMEESCKQKTVIVHKPVTVFATYEALAMNIMGSLVGNYHCLI